MKEINTMNSVYFIQCISVHFACPDRSFMRRGMVLIILPLKSLWTEPVPAFASGWQNIKNKLVLIRDNSWLNTTLKMQNKAKRKSLKIPVIPCTQRTNKSAFSPPQPKNKPKQSHRNVAQASSLSVTPASLSRRSVSEDGSRRKSPKRQRRDSQRLESPFQMKNNPRFLKPQVSSPKPVFMTNKPNLKISKNTVSPYCIAGCWKPKAGSSEKNKPKQSQIKSTLQKYPVYRTRSTLYNSNIRQRRNLDEIIAGKEQIMIHHPIVLGAKAILLLIIIIILVILHGILTPEQFRIAVKIGIAVFVAAVFIIWTVFFMMLNNPNSRLHKHMVLTTASGQTAEEKIKENAKLTALIGKEGIAHTNLRPSGIGRFGDELLDVVSDRTFIEKDQPIVVTAVEGKKVKVKKVET